MMVGGLSIPFPPLPPQGKTGRALGISPTQASIAEAGSYWPRLVTPKGSKTSIPVRTPVVQAVGTSHSAMLKEALNLETKLRTVQVSVWFDDAREGNST